jgi:hypothetical protein
MENINGLISEKGISITPYSRPQIQEKSHLFDLHPKAIKIIIN